MTRSEAKKKWVEQARKQFVKAMLREVKVQNPNITVAQLAEWADYLVRLSKL